MIYEGRVGPFVFLLILSAISYLRLRQIRSGSMPKIRHLAALDAVEEAIGRAAEMGRPVFFNAGYAGGAFTTIEAPIQGAAMSLLEYTARLCARHGTGITMFLGPTNMIPITLDVIKNAYRMEDHLDDYNESMVRWLSDSQFVYCAGFMGAAQRERPASHIMFGGFWYESILLGEAGRAAGAFTVGGTPRQGQIYFLVAICDYCLIGDEYYAAAAKVSEDTETLSSIWAADDLKLLILGLLVVGALLNILNANFIAQFLAL